MTTPIIKWNNMFRSNELESFKSLIPDNINNYYNPFCGNLGTELYLLNNQKANDLHVSDNCKDLIDFYFIITYKLDDFLRAYDNVTEKKVDFYKIRKRFNETENIIEKSLTFFMLNKMISGILTLNDEGKCIQGRGKHMVNWKLTRTKLIELNEQLKNKKLLMYQKHFTNLIDLNEIKEDDFVLFNINYLLSNEEVKQLRNMCENLNCKWLIRSNSFLSEDEKKLLSEDYYDKNNKEYVMNYIQ